MVRSLFRVVPLFRGYQIRGGGSMKDDAMQMYEEGSRDITIARDPVVVLEEAKRAAKALKDVISKKEKKVMMNGEQYLEFEDWQTVARFYGATVKVVSTEF